MKKLFLVSIALLSVLVFSACSSDDSVAKRAEGTYMVERHSYVTSPALSVATITSAINLVVKAEADYFVKVVIPTTSYDLEDLEMVIPEFTVSGVPVVDDLENGAEILKHPFMIEGNKNIEGTIAGEFDEDGEVEVVVEYKYGKMPFAIKQTFTNKKKDLDYDN